MIVTTACADPFIESVSQLDDTTDTGGPYTVWAVAVGVQSDDRVELFYNAIDPAADPFIPLLMEPADADEGAYEGELFAAGIPGQPAGSAIRYYVAITRDGERVAADPVGADVRPFVFAVVP